MSDLLLTESSSGAKDKNDKDAVWITELTDSLTVAIALREWSKAVSLIEEGTQTCQKNRRVLSNWREGEAKLAAAPHLQMKLAVLRSSLISSLLHALSEESNRKSSIIELTGLLQTLHATQAAQTAFLDARTCVTRKRIRMIRFEGNVKIYISDLATVVFTGIKHTADWFLASFKENDSTSGLFRVCSV